MIKVYFLFNVLIKALDKNNENDLRIKRKEVSPENRNVHVLSIYKKKKTKPYKKFIK